MSTEVYVVPRVGTTTLASWISRLVDALDADPCLAGRRLRALLEGRVARIRLDDDVVLVAMEGGELRLALDGAEGRGSVDVDGEGGTTSSVVVAILDGTLEVDEAIRTGLIEASGTGDAVATMFHGIEVLLDASSRVPALRRLAAEFRRGAAASAVADPQADDPDTELALLARLGLIGDP